MVAGEFLTLTPQFPKLAELDPQQITVTYDSVSDTLMLHFYGPGRPAISVEAQSINPNADEHMYLRVDVETQQVIGVQVEAFLRAVVRRDPSQLELLEFAGMHPTEVQKLREQIAPETRKQAAVGTFFGQLIPAGVAS